MNASSYNRGLRVAWILFFSFCVILVPILLLKDTLPDRHKNQIVADILGMGTQLQMYKSMNGFYPTTEQGLQALVSQSQSEPRPNRWYQFFKELPKDPWGNVYVYRCPGVKHPDKYDLFSAGPDRLPDTADDDWGE